MEAAVASARAVLTSGTDRLERIFEGCPGLVAAVPGVDVEHDPAEREPTAELVEEGKTAKNRVHLDVRVGADLMHERADALVALGATVVGEFDEPGGHWITLLDPEGNEFCIQ